MTERRCLIVTGAAGHLGSSVTAAALEAGRRVVALVRPEEATGVPAGAEVVTADWADAGALSRAIASAGACDVVHCAGLGVRSGARPAGVADLYDANVATVWRLLSALGPGPTGNVVLVSSAAVYGPHPVTPTPETAQLVPTRHYAASKVAAEAVASAFHGAGARTVVARPFNIVGTIEPSDSVLGVIAAQLEDAAAAGPDEVEVRVREDSSVRDFLDMRDVAEALLVLAERGEPGHAYNVCSGTGVSISTLVTAAGAAWGVSARSLSGSPGRGPDVSIGDPSAIEALGWKPRYSLADALCALRDARRAEGATR